MQLFTLPKLAMVNLLAVSCFLSIGCRQHPNDNLQNQLALVKDSVGKMAQSVAKKVSEKGPIEWLMAFENSPDFFMADDGQLSFSNYDSAAIFINNNLVKHIRTINLGWSNMRIEPLSPTLASLAANYKENIKDFAGKTTVYKGYFTAIAKHTPQGWKLHSVHWSSFLDK